jgi:GTP-binding protein EngB required for normal cell division
VRGGTRRRRIDDDVTRCMRDDEDDQGYDYASSDSEAYAYDSRDERSEGESSFEAYEDDLTSEEEFVDDDGVGHDETAYDDAYEDEHEESIVVRDEDDGEDEDADEGEFVGDSTTRDETLDDVEGETMSAADAEAYDDEQEEDIDEFVDDEGEEEIEDAGDDDDDDEYEEETETNATAGEEAAAKFRAAGAAAPMLAKSFASTVREAAGSALTAIKPKAAPVEPLVKPDPSDEDAMRAYNLQMLRIKLLRLASRLDQSPRNTVVAQVIYRLELAEQLKAGRGGQRAQEANNSSFDRAVALAEQAEKDNAGEDLEFTCTILLLGKSGVGKSAVINSLLGEGSAPSGTSDADATKKVTLIEKKVHGMTLRLIDTPGLQASAADIRYNSTIMNDAKRFTKSNKPDIVLYFDRLDIPSRSDAADLPLLKQITSTFGQAVWFNAIVVLTHASAAPPDGANGQPISYEMYVAQRSHIVQQTIRQAAGDMRLMNPVALAENHPMCRTNRAGERVLPNGQVWRPQLLLLCFASKILTEANTLLNLQAEQQKQGAGGRGGMPGQQKVPPLPFLLSSLITTRKPRRLIEYADDDFEDLENEIISGEPSPYDIPADQMEPLPTPKQVAIPAPDPVLPPSFDGDTPGHHYRFLESNQQWSCRPIVDAHGWDHEAGIEGFSVEHQFVLKDQVPGVLQAQISKDKKDSNLGFEGEMSIPHSRNLISTTGVDIQTVGGELVYTARGETRWKFCAVDKLIGGLSASLVGGVVALGTKIENRFKARPGMKIVVSTGAVTAQKDVAYAGNLEAIVRHSEDPSNPNSSTVSASFMNWRGDLALGCNGMSSIQVGKDTQLTGSFNINSRGTGKISVRATTNERMSLGSVGLVPIICAIWGRIRGD